VIQEGSSEVAEGGGAHGQVVHVAVEDLGQLDQLLQGEGGGAAFDAANKEAFIANYV